MNRQEIKPGVFLMTPPADKFNECRILLQFQFPARRDAATADALLPFILDRGYAACPDMTELSRLLARLYGAELSVNASVNGANRVLTVQVGGIKPAFALAGENLEEEYAKLAVGIALDPALENGVFSARTVEIEKGKLKQQLEAEINDKLVYCLRQARRKFFGSSPAGIEQNGYLDEVDGITPAALTARYREILRTAQIDLMVLGMDAQPVRRLLEAKLTGIERTPLPCTGPVAQPPQAPAAYAEQMELVQAKLCLLFTMGAPADPEEMAAYRLAMSLFGGSTSSRLFLNVREKQSLCYYCSASFASATACMVVNSGVDPQNAARAEAAILHELDSLCHGEIGEEELENCRRGLLSALASVEDSLAGVGGWYAMELRRGGQILTPEQSRKALQAVTAQQVQAVLSRFTLSVRYLVTTEEHADD